jgi:hypothetical protein
MQYACQPLSRYQLRGYAYSFRKALKLDEVPWLPVPKLLEAFCSIIGDDDFHFVCDPDESFEPDVHAAYLPEQNCIRIRESVYLQACDGNGRDRMTIMHELAHVLLLKVSGLQFTRCFPGQVVKPYCDPEWQAKCLAGELMMPYHLVKDKNEEEIATLCGVSLDAARFQKSRYK